MEIIKKKDWKSDVTELVFPSVTSFFFRYWNRYGNFVMNCDTHFFSIVALILYLHMSGSFLFVQKKKSFIDFMAQIVLLQLNYN